MDTLEVPGLATMGWAIALHGGAGVIPVDILAERREPREAALHSILQIGVTALNAKYSALDVVELVVTSYHIKFSLLISCVIIVRNIFLCSFHFHDMFSTFIHHLIV